MIKKDISAEKIMELERLSCKMFQDKNVDGAMEYVADDILLFNPGSAMIKGSKTEREMLTAATQMENFEMSWEPTDVYVSDSDDLAYVYGVIRSKMENADEQFENYITIYKKVNGNWKVALQMRNSTVK